MARRWLRVAPVVLVAWFAGCAAPEPTDENLRDSFAERIATSSFVTDFERNGDEMTFRGPDLEGETVSWRVRIDTSLVEPNPRDEAMPYQGRVTSEWYAEGELVGALGSMNFLPMPFLDRGLAQECFALWVEAEGRWDW